MSFRNAAAAVVARLFRLVNNAGQTVAALSNTINNAYVVNGSGLQMMHGDTPVVQDSLLGWTRQLSSTEYTFLQGPSSGVTTSKGILVLGYNFIADVPTAQLIVAGPIGRTGSITFNVNGNGWCQIQSDLTIQLSSSNIGLSSAGGTTVDLTAGTSIRLLPTTSVTLNGRTAFMLVFGTTSAGGDTGNKVGASTTIMITKVLNLLVGDLVQMDATAWIVVTTASLFSGVGFYVDGVSVGQILQTSSNNAFETHPVPPYLYVSPSTNPHTFTLVLTVQAGGTLRVVESTMRLLVFATN